MSCVSWCCGQYINTSLYLYYPPLTIDAMNKVGADDVVGVDFYRGVILQRCSAVPYEMRTSVGWYSRLSVSSSAKLSLGYRGT
jgi:hypothetical protein